MQLILEKVITADICINLLLKVLNLLPRGIKNIKLFSVYLSLLDWGKEFIDEFTAMEKKFYCVICCG